MAPTNLFLESLGNCFRMKESRFEIGGNPVVTGTLVANATAKLKVMYQICSKLSVRIVCQFLS